MDQMSFAEIKTFEDLERYLRHFHSWGDNRTLYDFGGVVALFIALLENLKEYGHGDLESIGYRFTDAQRAVLKDLSNLVNSMKDRDIEEELNDVK